MAKSRLKRLTELGQSVWIDSLSREMLETGELERLIREDSVSGVTSNPTIFQKALAEGEWYDAELSELATLGDTSEIFFRLAERDVSQACDLLRPVHEATSGLDGYVSIEVDPTLAYETERTYEQTLRLHADIDRPNLYVKIPATRAGLPAIEDAIATGHAVNITLIFSLRRYAEVVEAYLRGLERLVSSAGSLERVNSVASFFVSRVDSEADKRLEAVGTPEALALRGKLAVANAKLAYRHFQSAFSGERWQFLASKGAPVQRCLWASTSTKNPAYPDTLYVDELIGPDTVNTMPIETVRAFQDHGTIGQTLAKGVDEAERVLEQLEAVGVSYDEIVETLEEEGVQKFADSFTRLKHGIESKLRTLEALR
ncbi:MAG: transaldolase [Gaiellaceae bacterium]|jgi:transaldolase